MNGTGTGTAFIEKDERRIAITGQGLRDHSTFKQMELNFEDLQMERQQILVEYFVMKLSGCMKLERVSVEVPPTQREHWVYGVRMAFAGDINEIDFTLFNGPSVDIKTSNGGLHLHACITEKSTSADDALKILSDTAEKLKKAANWRGDLLGVPEEQLKEIRENNVNKFFFGLTKEIEDDIREKQGKELMLLLRVNPTNKLEFVKR